MTPFPSPLETLNTPPLNQHGFLSLPDAQQKVKAWRPDYNRVRLHGSRGIIPRNNSQRGGGSLQER
jgi:hypothetical protein